MDQGLIIFVVFVILILVGGLVWWYFFSKPVTDCTKKEADKTKHIKTWIKDDKTTNCIIGTCESKYEKSSDGTTCTIKANKPKSSKYKPYSDYPCHDENVKKNTKCPQLTYEKNTTKTQADCEKLCDSHKRSKNTNDECTAISWDETNKKCSLYTDQKFSNLPCTDSTESCYKKTS